MTARAVTAEEVKSRALALGFDACGVARAERLGEEAARLDAWLAAGRHADLDWMARTRDVRVDPTDARMVAGARSVIVLAVSYALGGDERVGPAPGRVARYAHGRDYHRVLAKRLAPLAAWLTEAGHGARVAVDSKPVFERAWAARAGLGFIGKNACLIVPGLGSHLFLAAVVTTADLEPDAPMRERCGDCRLCLDACPTDALVSPREVDARRCVSYLTIEREGPIPEALRAGVGDWVFGCDACQDVCPYNRGAHAEAAHAAPFAPHARWAEHDAAALLTMEEATFLAYAEGSPVRRAGADSMARNAAVVLGNVGGHVHLPVLDAAAAGHRSPVVREAAGWAASEVRRRGA